MKTENKKHYQEWSPLFDEFEKKAIRLIAAECRNKELEQKLPLGESGTEKLVKRITILFCCSRREGIVFFACYRGIVWCGR